MKSQFYLLFVIFLVIFVFEAETSQLRISKNIHKDSVHITDAKYMSNKGNTVEYSKYTLLISFCYNDYTTSTTSEDPTSTDDSLTETSISTYESTTTIESSTTEVTTTKTEEATTTEPTTTESSDTEDDSDDSTVINKENDEILTLNKKKIRFLTDYNIEGVEMTNVVDASIKEYYSMNKVEILESTISITSEDNNKTLNIVVILLIENEYREIAVLLEEYINMNKNNTFYNLLSNKCNNLYSYCSNDNTPSTATIPTTTTTTLPTITECIYPSKSIFIYGSGVKVISNNNSISNNNNVVVTYSSSSSSDCSIDRHTGNITIDTDKKITDGFIKCIITCSYEGIKDETSIIQYKVTQYKPSVDILLSSFPYTIYQNEEFNVKLTLVYPFITDLVMDEDKYDMNISLSLYSEDNKYMLQNSPIYKQSKTVFEYNDLIVTNATEEISKDDDDELHNDDDDDDDEDKDDDKISFHFMNESSYIYKSEEIKVIGIKSPENCKKDERDNMGLCCVGKKDCINGVMCKNLTFIIPFINNVDDLLFDTYYNIFNDIIFNNTNYLWHCYMEDYNKKVIIVKINIKDNKSNNRLLLVEEDSNLVFDNYDYIKSVLSILECTDETEIEERINILPNEIKELIVNSKLDTKIKTSIKEINKVNEETGNRIDYDIGITSVFNYKSEEKEEEEENAKKPWYEEYIYVIVVVGIVVLLIILIILSYLLAYIGQKIEEKKMKKNEVVMQNVVPIEKIRENNYYNNNSSDMYRPNNQKIMMEGYLMKESHDRIYDKYQRRYCVLYTNPAILRIYGSMSQSYYGKVYLDEKQSIPLECYNGIDYEEGSNEFNLKLKIRESYLMTYEPGDKEIKISFKMDDEIENCSSMIKEWVENIKNYKNEKPVVSEAWTKPAVVNEEENRSSSTSTEYYKPDVLEKAKARKQGGVMSNKRSVTIKSN